MTIPTIRNFRTVRECLPQLCGEEVSVKAVPVVTPAHREILERCTRASVHFARAIRIGGRA